MAITCSDQRGLRSFKARTKNLSNPHITRATVDFDKHSNAGAGTHSIISYPTVRLSLSTSSVSRSISRES